MNVKLTSMKMDKADREELKPATAAPADLPVYPWGLQVRLDEKSLDKLGIKDLPKVDGERLLVAKVKVVGVSSNEHSSDGPMGKHKHKSVELQITDMALDDVPAEKSDAEAIYEG